MPMKKNARVEGGRRCDRSEKSRCNCILYMCVSECVCVHIYRKRRRRRKGICGGSVAFRPVTYCRCEACLLGRMGLMGSLFLRLDCTLDERARSPWEGAASSDELQEEPRSAPGRRANPAVIDNRGL